MDQGAFYPALYRLEKQGLIEATWGQSENNGRARFYNLTYAGRKRLKDEVGNWGKSVRSMAPVLSAKAAPQ
jgi:DNA-binding PadR family transcriptional regulator